ncbi:MAG: cysteine desulfurase [Ruminococcaceae bacterium]|nr:cysteine desulfurase [Oscillospiraceae bacterium]
MSTVYFDNSATTPLCPEAREAMCAAMDCYGNPSSLHTMGVAAEKLVSDARRAILATLGVKCTTKIAENQLIFTASGTEADNLALIGAASAKKWNCTKKILISDSEHPAVLEPAAELERRGFEVVRIPTVGGLPDYGMIEAAADKNIILASFMLVNNETGAVYDIPRIAKLIKAKNPDALLHADCVQGYLKIPFTVKSLGADLITLSAHKIGGPKGVGALYMTQSVITKKQISPVIFGGGQEFLMRSGTENVIGISGFGAAAKAGHKALSASIAAESAIRAHLIGALSGERFSGIRLNLPENAAPHILSITLPSIKSETMLHSLSRAEIFVSSGSACSSNTGHGSHVLRAFGLSDKEADCTIRISLGPQNTIDDANRFLDALEGSLQTLVRI